MVLSGASQRATAQNNGAADLLFPIGARVTGTGQASVAEPGADGVWWNPAGLARMTKPEFNLDHFSTFAVPSGDAISLVLPVSVVGVFGIGARYFSFCPDCESTDGSAQATGIAALTSVVVSASFAASFGPRLSAGITGRVYQYSTNCTGVCNGAFANTTAPSTTGMIDVGLQYRPSATSPLQLGASLSNLGSSLQINNQSQADPLPTRVHLGLSYTPTSASWDPALHVRLMSELVATPSFGAEQEVHAGADVSYTSGKTMLSLRGGYVYQQTASSTGGPSLGFGIASGRVQLDVARIFDSVSSGLGNPPTYISIRVGL